jgi:glutamate racemase
VAQEACPLWVPLVENNQFDNLGGRYFVEHHLANLLNKDPKLDTIVLGCTHYPILLPIIEEFIPKNITILNQGKIVANKLADYLNRHSDLANKCSTGGQIMYYTTDNPIIFEERATLFIGKNVNAHRIKLKD